METALGSSGNEKTDGLPDGDIITVGSERFRCLEVNGVYDAFQSILNAVLTSVMTCLRSSRPAKERARATGSINSRYVLHRYFVHKCGWYVKGWGPMAQEWATLLRKACTTSSLRIPFSSWIRGYRAEAVS